MGSVDRGNGQGRFAGIGPRNRRSVLLAGGSSLVAGDRRSRDHPVGVDAREYFASGNKELPLRESEALIRAALGEEQLAAGIPGGTTVSVEMQLLTKLVADLRLTSEQIDALVAEAEQMISGRGGGPPDPAFCCYSTRSSFTANPGAPVSVRHTLLK